MRATIAPYMRPSSGLVDHGGWHVGDGPEETPLPADVRHWDYQASLRLKAAISVDREMILQECGLGPSTELAVVVRARSDHTNAHGLIARVEVPSADRYDLAVETELEGHTLGGRLDLVTMLVVTSSEPLGPLAPHRPGSILWTATHRAHLEGNAARFPTDAADFRQSRPSEARAGWHLHLDVSDPDASFMSAARLTLNTGLEGIKDLTTADAHSSESLLRMIRWDVTRQLVMRALAWDEIGDTPPDFESSSVSAVLRGLLARIWPHEMPSVLRQRLAHEPDFIELQIQHHERVVTD